jgi:CDP-diacylglycerol---serine O-phosphatidyltransferase
MFMSFMGRLRRLRSVIPSVATLGNAGFGFAAILLAAQAHGSDPARRAHLLAVAAWAVAGAWLCDMADGMLARALGATSRFGAQLDSLCDAVGFGVAPAVLVAVAAPALGGVAPLWAAAAGLALLAMALVRLARFNVEPDGDPRGHLYFKGLPSAGAAMLVAALVLLAAGSPRAEAIARALPFVAVALALLMVSRFRYADLPRHYRQGRQPAWHLAILALLALLVGPVVVMVGFFGLYAVASPLIRSSV